MLEAEEVVPTMGLSWVNGFMNEAFPTALNEKGWIQADEYFRVPGGAGKIFALGDCSTFLPNSGYQILDNLKLIGGNIKTTQEALAAEGTAPADEALKKGVASYQVTLSTVGPNGGVFYTPAFYTQWIFPYLKNKTLLLFRPKYELGLTE